MHSALEAASPEARAVARLFLAMLVAGGVVWLAVVLSMIVAVRRSPDSGAENGARRSTREKGVAIATGVSVAILILFLGYDFVEGRTNGGHHDADVTVDVTGHQWWWEVQYPAEVPKDIIVTANELHVPVGKMIQIRLLAADVIHSFWVPNLNGKRDLIPGYRTTVWFRADTAGVYDGQCAEFCGLQHAHMRLKVIAEPPEKFAQWVEAARQPNAAPADSVAQRGQMVFLSSNCAVCHSIAGTPAFATVGPNLSHLKSRSMIASGTLENTASNLMGWISNPAAIKPGTQMPPSKLSGPDLQALVAYLETLK
jgi:cytochrome c oxidase subunit 2